MGRRKWKRKQSVNKKTLIKSNNECEANYDVINMDDGMSTSDDSDAGTGMNGAGLETMNSEIEVEKHDIGGTPVNSDMTELHDVTAVRKVGAGDIVKNVMKQYGHDVPSADESSTVEGHSGKLKQWFKQKQLGDDSATCDGGGSSDSGCGDSLKSGDDTGESDAGENLSVTGEDSDDCDDWKGWE